MGDGLPVAFEICWLERLNTKKFLKMSSGLEELSKSGIKLEATIDIKMHSKFPFLTCYLISCFNSSDDPSMQSTGF
jgi:hypothetical protein